MTAASKHDFPHFVSIKRIMNLPVVSSGVDKVTKVYVRVKSSNKVIEFSLNNAEKTVLGVAHLYSPIMTKLEDPINKIDDLVCMSLDVVEDKIPIVTYTPEEIYFTTKTYVKNKVDPVLKRADSVKQIAMLDDALSKADEYVDKYLPDNDAGDDVTDKPGTEPSSQTVKTIRHVNHFSRKLQRRLTRRTIAEAKLLKKQSYDTIQCFVYFADLLARDPKAFAEKMKTIWKHLSEPEPENQKPPGNIEQLIEMLSREGARRFVHATNYTVKCIYMIPTYVKRATNLTVNEALHVMDKIIKFAHLENVKGAVVDATNKQLAKYNGLAESIKKLIMEYISSYESKNKEAKKENKSNAAKANKSQKDEKHKAAEKSSN